VAAPCRSTSTIGGNVAENAGGLRGLNYGVTRDYVMGPQAVLPASWGHDRAHALSRREQGRPRARALAELADHNVQP